MDRYQRVEKPKAETPIDENEIRITSQGRMRSYITYAMTLLECVVRFGGFGCYRGDFEGGCGIAGVDFVSVWWICPELCTAAAIKIKSVSHYKPFRILTDPSTEFASSYCSHRHCHQDTLKALNEKAKVLEVPKSEPEPAIEILFLCRYEGCGRTFVDAGALKNHSQIHGDRQYICHYEGCGRKFVDSSKLKPHFLRHTGEKDFVCPHEGCGKAPTNTQNYILPPEKPLKTPKPATLAKAFRARRVYTNRGRG